MRVHLVQLKFCLNQSILRNFFVVIYGLRLLGPLIVRGSRCPDDALAAPIPCWTRIFEEGCPRHLYLVPFKIEFIQRLKFMFGHLLFRQVDEVVFLVLGEICLSYVYHGGLAYDGVNVLLCVSRDFPKIVSKILDHVHHAIHFQKRLLHLVVQEGDTDSVDCRPTIVNEEIENGHQDLDGQRARIKRQIPFESKILCLHVHVPEMQIELLAVLLDIFLEGVVHDVELGQALEEQVLHFDRLILEEMYESEE